MFFRSIIERVTNAVVPFNKRMYKCFRDRPLIGQQMKGEQDYEKDPDFGTTGSSGVSNSSNASPGPGSSTTNGTSGSVQESSKGVIDGLVDDVEQGVEDLTGETTSRASDESK